jgi:hypothetical protein
VHSQALGDRGGAHLPALEYGAAHSPAVSRMQKGRLNDQRHISGCSQRTPLHSHDFLVCLTWLPVERW